MLIRQLGKCPEIVSADGCLLRELLNARKDRNAFLYSLAHAVVKSGQVTKPHRLKSSEVYYILEGRGRMHVNQETADAVADCVIDIPPHAIQFIENTGTSDLVFLCIVDPAWRPEDEEILTQP